MKIYSFYYKNYYRGSRTFKVIANSQEEAEAFLQKEEEQYLNDDESILTEEYVEDIHIPLLFSI